MKLSGGLNVRHASGDCTQKRIPGIGIPCGSVNFGQVPVQPEDNFPEEGIAAADQIDRIGVFFQPGEERDVPLCEGVRDLRHTGVEIEFGRKAGDTHVGDLPVPENFLCSFNTVFLGHQGDFRRQAHGFSYAFFTHETTIAPGVEKMFLQPHLLKDTGFNCVRIQSIQAMERGGFSEYPSRAFEKYPGLYEADSAYAAV
ncbi:MAG: hypothetical protein IKE16_05415, partial [Solobacterium sp.]|nr:hypothetical protein [Solobacterium sp.]